MALAASQLEKPVALLSFCSTVLRSMLLIWPAPAACFASLSITEASSLLHKARASAAQKKTAAVCFTKGFQRGPYRSLADSSGKKPPMHEGKERSD